MGFLNALTAFTETTAIDPVAKVTEMIGTVDMSMFVSIVVAVLTATLGVSVTIIALMNGYNFLLSNLKQLRKKN